MLESRWDAGWLALGLLLAVLLAGPARALQLTDDRGVKVTLAQSPQRIVSLLPALTESVCALGQCQRLVGVDRFSNYPPEVRALQQVGGGIDPNLETIVALKPDLVLLASSSRAIERLQSLGIAVLALEPKTHADVRRVLALLGRVLVVPAETGAVRVWHEIELAMTAATQSLPARVKNTRVYFEVNSAPYAASEASFIGETLARLGVKNIVPASLGAFPKLNPEYVVRANPDIILVGDSDAAALLQRPGWAALRAIREQRVCTFSQAQSDILVRPGPRMAEGARLMAQCLADKVKS